MEHLHGQELPVVILGPKTVHWGWQTTGSIYLTTKYNREPTAQTWASGAAELLRCGTTVTRLNGDDLYFHAGSDESLRLNNLIRGALSHRRSTKASNWSTLLARPPTIHSQPDCFFPPLDKQLILAHITCWSHGSSCIHCTRWVLSCSLRVTRDQAVLYNGRTTE